MASLLALVGNPPAQNPIGLMGPSVTLAPFNPAQKVFVDLFNVGWVKGKRRRGVNNPPQGSVIFNPFTEEARRYHALSPEQAVLAAWQEDHARAGAPVEQLPVQTAPGWARSGPWLARTARPNPKKFSMKRLKGTALSWAYTTLELIWWSRQATELAQVQKLMTPPVVLVNWDLWKAFRGVAVGVRAKGVAKGDAEAKAWERWKEVSRELALERLDAYDAWRPYPTWFAFDMRGALDAAWVQLGSPYPLDTAPGRDVTLLKAAQVRARGPRALTPRAHVPTEFAFAHELATAKRVEELMTRELEPYGKEFPAREKGTAVRGYAVDPGFKARVRELEAWGPIEAPRGLARFARSSEFTEGKAASKRAVSSTFVKRPWELPIDTIYDEYPWRGEWVPRDRNPAAEELRALMDPNRERRRNRDSKWKRPPEVENMTLAEVEAWNAEMLPLSEKKYKRFHSTAPTRGKKFYIDDGREEVTRDPTIYVGLHETLETPYVVPWNSSKRGTGREPIVWFHEHPEDGRPLEVLNPETGITSKVGGTFVVDDFWYS